uniref:DUF4283 domain-containing protein n=1 Tax=Cannabis sativa TaxID=3483 RepID=A0A803NT95_CANSA
MAGHGRPRKGPSQGRGKSRTKLEAKKPKKRGSSSTADVKKTKRMDEILGVEPMEFSDEEDRVGSEDLDDPGLIYVLQAPVTPRSSLKSIKQQEVVCLDFAFFLKANQKCAKSIKEGNASIPPVLKSESVKKNLVNSFENKCRTKIKINMEDIEDEIAFWNPSIVCYILGANPPLAILESFARQLLQDNVDKVGLLSYDIFLIQFNDVAIRDEILSGGYIFFNKRPVIMKEWDPNMNVKKEDIRAVPIWVQLEDLELKYWGEKSLFKIIRQVGKPIMVDAITKQRDKLAFRRVLIEVLLNQPLPDLIWFEDEFGSNVSVQVKYE